MCASDACEQESTEIEPVTAERVERDRARLLSLAERCMDVAEASSTKHGEPPPAHLVHLWSLIGDKAGPERVRGEGQHVLSTRGRGGI